MNWRKKSKNTKSCMIDTKPCIRGPHSKVAHKSNRNDTIFTYILKLHFFVRNKNLSFLPGYNICETEDVGLVITIGSHWTRRSWIWSRIPCIIPTEARGSRCQTSWAYLSFFVRIQANHGWHSICLHKTEDKKYRT